MKLKWYEAATISVLVGYAVHDALTHQAAWCALNVATVTFFVLRLKYA